MDTEESRTLVMEAWQAFASRDPNRIAAVLAEDAEWLAPPGNATAVALGHSDHMVGRDAIVRFISAEFGKLFHEVRVDFRGFYADGATVVVEERMRATLVNRRPYDNAYCFVFECANGAIVRVREYMDTLAGQRMLFGDDVPARIVK